MAASFITRTVRRTFSFLRPSPPTAQFPIPCAQARGLASAHLDREVSGSEEIHLAEHLQGCRDCAEFLARAADLERATRLVTLVSIPNLTSMLIAELRKQGPSRELSGISHSLWMRLVRPVQRTVRWVTVIVPLGVALAALSVGAFTTVHVTPSNTRTPCTARVESGMYRHDIHHKMPPFVNGVAPQ